MRKKSGNQSYKREGWMKLFGCPKMGSGLNFKRNGGRLRCVWGNSPWLRWFTSENNGYRKLSYIVLARKLINLFQPLHDGPL